MYGIVWSSDRRTDRRTEGQTESDAYEPTVQYAQVGSKMGVLVFTVLFFISQPTDSTKSARHKSAMLMINRPWPYWKKKEKKSFCTAWPFLLAMHNSWITFTCSYHRLPIQIIQLMQPVQNGDKTGSLTIVNLLFVGDSCWGNKKKKWK